jgi:predicted nucleic acid-binding protein
VIGRGVPILQLKPQDLSRVTKVSQAQRLDFDDAFVYTIAEDHDLVIVSFDADFDHTTRGRTTPEALLAGT